MSRIIFSFLFSFNWISDIYFYFINSIFSSISVYDFLSYYFLYSKNSLLINLSISTSFISPYFIPLKVYGPNSSLLIEEIYKLNFYILSLISLIDGSLLVILIIVFLFKYLLTLQINGPIFFPLIIICDLNYFNFSSVNLPCTFIIYE